LKEMNTNLENILGEERIVRAANLGDAKSTRIFRSSSSSKKLFHLYAAIDDALLSAQMHTTHAEREIGKKWMGEQRERDVNSHAEELNRDDDEG